MNGTGMKKIGSLLDVGPDSPEWVKRNFAESARLQSQRVAKARMIIRDETVSGRARPTVGSNDAALARSEELWLAEWVSRECDLLLARAEAELGQPARKLKHLEKILDEVFAFVLSATNYSRIEELIKSARSRFTGIVDRRIHPPVVTESAAVPAKRKKGRKPKYDAGEDARLLKQFRSLTPRLSEKEFAESIGKVRSYRTIRRALQRARSRERLMADYKSTVKGR